MVADGDNGALSELHESSNLTRHDVHCSLRNHRHPFLLLHSSVYIRSCAIYDIHTLNGGTSRLGENGMEVLAGLEREE